ncbi:DUF4253 domain-containing protein [Streptomyces sp. NPDC049040]|uniref:DUF4253 domain-containing protein n=1 Tax=Streptomyces sp. NPDC049040 TaxID=3365593 RepID=UPI003723AA23
METRTADRILAEQWQTYVTDDDYEPEDVAEEVAPFGFEWPGLADAPSGPWADADQLALKVLADVAEGQQRQNEMSKYGKVEFALRRPYRSAEVPALFEERHMTFVSPYGAADLCTILGSWEERFGTRLVGFADDRVIVSVAAPVRTIGEAERIAAEHFAFSPDTIVQDYDGILSVYAANQVLGCEVWSFWWD